MGGKASLLLVLGFSLIFLVVGHNFNNLSVNAVDNITDYYVESMAHNIAVSGANMAASQVFMDKTWGDGYSDLSFAGGIINVYISNPEATGTKVTICHIPPGNPDAQHTINVSSSAVPAHLAHGDYLGSCGDPINPNEVIIISEGTFQGVTKVVTVKLRPSHFSKFGNFYKTVSAAPATGDTFNGPFHANSKLTTYGTPVFWGKVTTKNGLKLMGAPKDPKFYGGYESGVDIPLQFDTTGMRSTAQTNGYIFRDTTGSAIQKPIDVKLDFNADGTVTHSFMLDNDGSWTTPQTTPLSTLAPNGLIYVERGNIYTKGTVNGKVTIVATRKGKNGYGKVIQTDDLVYNDDPRIVSSSDDILGIVAEQEIRIEENANTLGKDINTHASMFSLNSDIGPADGLVTQGYLGKWKILGGLIASTTRVTAEYGYSGGIFVPTNGLKFVHTYDERFLMTVPPSFPHTESFEVVSWFE